MAEDWAHLPLAQENPIVFSRNFAGNNVPPIRVLIAADTALMRAALSRLVTSAPSLQICGTAGSGPEALEKIPQLDPDVITLDVGMPLMNGLEVLKRIMADFPRPVIMVSALTPEGAEMTLEALGVGAFDCFPKTHLGNPIDPEELRRDLIEKIEAAAHSPLARRLDSSSSVPPPSFAVSLAVAVALAQPSSAREFHGLTQIVAIGTSTGGPKALLEILPQLPADLPVGILVVQHMPPGFTAALAKRLDSLSPIAVREATHGALIEPGVVYIAPAGQHSTVWREAGGKAGICLSQHPPGATHTPSVDVMMLSVAESFGRHAMGIILTGMGKDGLLGMTAIRQAGGFTVGQDKSTSAVYGMPRCCAENGILQRVVPLFQIPGMILQAVHYRTPEKTLTAASGI
jgi:two-component system, chemotaxis family, protein-glutamate methylesterase/glutaminase